MTQDRRRRRRVRRRESDSLARAVVGGRWFRTGPRDYDVVNRRISAERRARRNTERRVNAERTGGPVSRRPSSLSYRAASESEPLSTTIQTRSVRPPRSTRVTSTRVVRRAAYPTESKRFFFFLRVGFLFIFFFLSFPRQSRQNPFRVIVDAHSPCTPDVGIRESADRVVICRRIRFQCTGPRGVPLLIVVDALTVWPITEGTRYCQVCCYCFVVYESFVVCDGRAGVCLDGVTTRICIYLLIY